MSETKPVPDFTSIISQYNLDELAKDADKAYETIEQLKKEGRHVDAETLNNAVIARMLEIEREKLN